VQLLNDRKNIGKRQRGRRRTTATKVRKRTDHWGRVQPAQETVTD